MAKKVKRRAKWREWTKSDDRELKAHSKAKTPVVKISKAHEADTRCSASESVHDGHVAWASAIGTKWQHRHVPRAC